MAKCLWFSLFQQVVFSTQAFLAFSFSSDLALWLYLVNDRGLNHPPPSLRWINRITRPFFPSFEKSSFANREIEHIWNGLSGTQQTNPRDLLLLLLYSQCESMKQFINISILGLSQISTLFKWNELTTIEVNNSNRFTGSFPFRPTNANIAFGGGITRARANKKKKEQVWGDDLNFASRWRWVKVLFLFIIVIIKSTRILVEISQVNLRWRIV